MEEKEVYSSSDEILVDQICQILIKFQIAKIKMNR